MLISASTGFITKTEEDKNLFLQKKPEKKTWDYCHRMILIQFFLSKNQLQNYILLPVILLMSLNIFKMNEYVHFITNYPENVRIKFKFSFIIILQHRWYLWTTQNIKLMVIAYLLLLWLVISRIVFTTILLMYGWNCMSIFSD